MDIGYISKSGPRQGTSNFSRFQHLSPDGQALMAAVHKYYYEEMENFKRPAQLPYFVNCQSQSASNFGTFPSTVSVQYDLEYSQQPNGGNQSDMELYQKKSDVSAMVNPSVLSVENGGMEHMDCASHHTETENNSSDSNLPNSNELLDRAAFAHKYIPLKSTVMEIQETPQSTPSVPLLLSDSQESTPFSPMKNPIPLWMMEDTCCSASDKEIENMQSPPSLKSIDRKSRESATSFEFISKNNDTICTLREKEPEQRAVKSTGCVMKRLDVHKEIRKSFTNECDKEQGISRKRMKDSHKQMQMENFCVPYKKKQTDVSQTESTQFKSFQALECQRNRQKNSGTICSDSLTITTVLALPESTRKTLFSEILSSDELLMSLYYSNGATQMREPASLNAKKKTASVKSRQTGEVKGICLLYKRGNFHSYEWSQDKVIYFQFSSNKDLNFRDFWESVIKCRARKVCCFAKDFMRALLQYVFVDENHLSGKSVLMDCDIMDPIVGCWLLNPDLPPANFNQALQLFHITQKEADVLNCTDIISQDFQHLSIMMGLLHQKLDNKGMWSLYYCVETKLTPLLASMENRSLTVDIKIFACFADILKRKLNVLEKKAFEAAGHAFLISSHAQLRQVLFEELKLDKKFPQRTKFAKTNVGHQMSTSEAVLNHLTSVHPLPGIVLEYRQIQKLKSTYVDGMMSAIRNGSLSTHWDQTSAATGRLTSYQPNIQAIPKTAVSIKEYKENYIIGKDSEDATIEILAREPFVSCDGWTLLAADFQQIELRLLAHLADDATLLGIFEKSQDIDIFLKLTSQWLNKPVSEVTTGEREQTKRVVYSVMYGVGKEKLGEYLKISAENAKGIMQSFLGTFPAVNHFTRKCVEFCQQFGYTKTIFHRQRLLPNIRHPSPPLRAQSERQAVNFCVQGSAADLCKSAMLQVEQALSNHPLLQAKLLVQIHDELLLEVANADMKDVQRIVKRVMEDRDALCGDLVKLKVPLKVSLSVGKSWGHMTHVDIEE